MPYLADLEENIQNFIGNHKNKQIKTTQEKAKQF